MVWDLSNGKGIKMKILYIWHKADEFYNKLKKFRNHRRFRVFWLKGLRCVNCNIIGNAIIKSRNNAGQIHYDLYRYSKQGRLLMTVDHIIPKSLGGTNNIKNLQPMCTKCNSKKGSIICLPMMATV